MRKQPTKLYMIKGRHGYKTYHNWKTVKNNVSSTETIVEFTLSKEYTLDELEKQINRDQDLHNLLGDGTSYPNIHHNYVKKMVIDYYEELKKNKENIYHNYHNYIQFTKSIGVSFTEVEFKSTLSDNKHILLTKICQTIEDYTNVLKVVNFRLTDRDRDKDMNRYRGYSEENIEMFDRAKKEIREEKKKK